MCGVSSWRVVFSWLWSQIRYSACVFLSNIFVPVCNIDVIDHNRWNLKTFCRWYCNLVLTVGPHRTHSHSFRPHTHPHTPNKCIVIHIPNTWLAYAYHSTSIWIRVVPIWICICSLNIMFRRTQLPRKETRTHLEQIADRRASWILYKVMLWELLWVTKTTRSTPSASITDHGWVSSPSSGRVASRGG